MKIILFGILISILAVQGEPLENEMFTFTVGPSNYTFNRDILLNWFDAAKECQDSRHLVKVDNLEELSQLSSSVDLVAFWIDTKKDKNGKLISAATGKESSFVQWNPNEPSGDGDCIALTREDPESDFGYDDMDCQEKLNFICELDVPSRK